jgi:hypothetical protein
MSLFGLLIIVVVLRVLLVGLSRLLLGSLCLVSFLVPEEMFWDVVVLTIFFFLVAVVQDALDTTDFGSGNVPFNENNFANNLANATF